MALNKTLSLQQLQLMQIEKMKKKLTSDVVSPSNGIDHDLGIVTVSQFIDIITLVKCKLAN